MVYHEVPISVVSPLWNFSTYFAFIFLGFADRLKVLQRDPIFPKVMAVASPFDCVEIALLAEELLLGDTDTAPGVTPMFACCLFMEIVEWLRVILRALVVVTSFSNHSKFLRAEL